VALEDSTGEFPEPLEAPQGAPNVLLVMGDDIGYGHMSGFGGPADTPVFDRLATQGLRFTNFHTTAVCAASRAALLTGRNAHSAGMGAIPEGLDRVPGLQRRHPAQRRDRAGDPAPERVRHRLGRQVPRHPDA
jgi:arylsulfatase A-like enzyme